MLKAVYDTNIIVSAALKQESLPALIVSLALQGKVRIYVSLAILEEYEEVLKRPRFKLYKNDVGDLMREIRQKAVLVKPNRKLDLIVFDETDNRILECAMKAKADFVVTGDKTHFTFTKFDGIKIATPREFVDEVGE